MKFITDLLPSTMQNDWCIAGGYAACPYYAGDVDVWVYNQHVDGLEDSKALILEHLNAKLAGFKHDWQRPFKVDEQTQTLHERQVTYEQRSITILKAAVVTRKDLFYRCDRRLQPIHIMVTDAMTPREILLGFDISTHAVAVDSEGGVWRHELFTAPNEHPIVLRDTKHTQDRYDRICARFGHTPVWKTSYSPTEASVGAE